MERYRKAAYVLIYSLHVQSDSGKYTISALADAFGLHPATLVSKLDVVQVGFDEDNEPITSCVIVPSEASSKLDRTRLIGATKIAFEALQDAIAEAGEPAPASNHIPRTCRTTTVKMWSGIVTPQPSPKATIRTRNERLLSGQRAASKTLN